MIDEHKLNKTIKIYPIFSGLTSDLIFWIAINTLFLTTVKGLSPSEINYIDVTGAIIGIICQLFLIKIVRKIGNLNSVKLGTILLFLSALLNTISTKYIGFLIAEICYVLGFVFKHMDSVILMKNLNYLNKPDEYIKIQTKASTIYSFITLIISLISGLLFNINPYIPMILCLIVCFINIILTHYIYEVPLTIKDKEKSKRKIKLDKKILIMLLLYGLMYSLIACGQKNSKLFIQLNMQNFLSLDKVALYMSVFIFFSRISRFISNLVFIKIYNRLKNKTIFLIETLLCFSFILLIIGNYLGYNKFGIITMSFGFFTFLFIRDPFGNYMKKNLLVNSPQEVHDKIVNHQALSRKISSAIYGLIISLMLTKLNYTYIMTFLLILSLTLIIIIIKIYKLIEINTNEV